MKTQQELCDILGFIAEYATYQLGSGVHTSRAVRNSRRIGEALGVDVQLSSFQKSTILTVPRPRERRVRNPCGGNPVAPHQFRAEL